MSRPLNVWHGKTPEGGETTEIKVDVLPDVWQKFEQMTGDVGKDRSAVLSEIISKAHAELFPKPVEPEPPEA